MKILNESRRVLAYTGLCSASVVPIGGLQVPRTFVRIGYVSAVGLCLTLHGHLCVENKDGFIAILLPIGAAITCASMFLVYISLMLKSDEITELLEYFQNFVDTSTIYVLLF